MIMIMIKIMIIYLSMMFTGKLCKTCYVYLYSFLIMINHDHDHDYDHDHILVNDILPVNCAKCVIQFIYIHFLS